MDSKLIILLALAASILPMASPAQEDCMEKFSTVVNLITSLLDEEISFNLNLPEVGPEELVVVGGSLVDAVLTGHKDIEALECTHDNEQSTSLVSLRAPRLNIYSDYYNLTGSLLGSIDLAGEGGAMFILDQFDMEFRGDVVTWDDGVIQFSNYTLDLLLDRWLVVLENLMPGTDYSALITEFLMMNGPDVFRVLGQQLSGRQAILDLVNSVFEPSNDTDTESFEYAAFVAEDLFSVVLENIEEMGHK